MTTPSTLPSIISSGDRVRLRSAEIADVPRLAALYSQLHPDESIDTVAFATELVQIGRIEGRRVYVYEVDGELVGTVDAFLMRNLSRGQRPWVGVENFVVDADRRRRGYGRAILDSVIEAARRAGAYKVQLISSDQRQDAHKLYSALGFSASVSGFRMYLAGEAK